MITRGGNASERRKSNFFSVLVFILMVLLLCVFTIPGERSCGAASDVLKVDEVLHHPGYKSVYEPISLSKIDVVFAIDRTGSMWDEIDVVKQKAAYILEEINKLVEDARYGLASFMDYPGYYEYKGYSNRYGELGDIPYIVNQPLTANKDAVISAVNSLTLGNGEDWPEDYTRVLYELQCDTLDYGGAVGWRPDARKFVVMFGDAPTHDLDFAGYNFGGDPGRDAVANTSDDLDFETVISGLKSSGITVLAVDSGGSEESEATFKGMSIGYDGAVGTGGIYYHLDQAEQIPSAILEMIQEKVLIPGDILICRSPGSLVPGHWSHVGMYIGEGKVVEANIPFVEITDLANWEYPRKTWVSCLRVKNANKDIRDAAVWYAKKMAEFHCPYDLNWYTKQAVPFPADPKSLISIAWYCSELVWAAYLVASGGAINLEHQPDVFGVSPDEIFFNDNEVKEIGGHFEAEPETMWGRDTWRVSLLCKADMCIVDPLGRTRNKEVAEIPGAIYGEDDMDGDGTAEDWISIPEEEVLPGAYRVSVIPNPDASPEDTFSLEFHYKNDCYPLLSDVKMCEIDEQPYTLEMRGGNIHFGSYYSTWYLAEGTTYGGMETWVLVQNPNDSDVTVDLTFQTEEGRKDGPQGFRIPANSRQSFLLNSLYNNMKDISTQVVSHGGEVICERAVYGAGKVWAHDSVGHAQ
jgi:hypothetical protein